MISNASGCKITMHCPNNDLLIITGESILAGIESVLSTTPLHKGVLCIESELDICLKIDSVLSGVQLKHCIDSENAQVEVRVSDFNPHKITASAQKALNDALSKLITGILPFLMFFKGPDQSLKKLFGTEKALDRAVNFTLSYIRLGNVVGHKPKYRLADWHSNGESDTALGSRPVSAIGLGKEKSTDLKAGIEETSHKQMKTAPAIRPFLWDDTGWQGVLYAFDPRLSNPPYLVLIFGNASAGKKIFNQWRERFGKIDEKDIIRVAIMRDIDPEHPHDYRIGVSANLKAIVSDDSLILSGARIHTMEPEHSNNLNNFLRAYKEKREYILTYATLDNRGNPVMNTALGITKKEIIIKTANAIQDDDIDKMLLGRSRAEY